MKITAILLALVFSASSTIIFDFNPSSDLSNWRIVDDVVMGGRSNGNFKLNDAGHGLFSGEVSLENNGGFSSLRYQFNTKEINDFKKVTIHLKGDGKRYQFRVKSKKYDQHSYITYFTTSGEWETIEIKLDKMYPSWRGMKLDMDNYPGETMEEIAFLISNKKAESFQLEIDKIELH
jgi:hypothetical protein